MNIIKHDGGVIGLTPDIVAYLEDLIKINIKGEEYEHLHKLIDVLSIVKTHKDDTLLEMNNAYYVRIIEEDI